MFAQLGERIVNNKGYVMVLALVIVGVLLVLLSMILGGIVIQRRLVDRSYHRERALALAESGIDIAIACLNEEDISEPSYPEISGEIPEMGTFLVGISASDGTLTITAIGYSRRNDKEKAQRTVEVIVSLDSVFGMAAFAGGDEENTIAIAQDVVIDSYDSEGTGQAYDPENSGNNGHIGTNSTSTSPKAVTIGQDSDIDGNVYIGAEGNPDEAISIGEGASVDDKLTLSENKELPQANPSIPPDLPYRGPLEIGKGKSEYVDSSGRYSSISIQEEGHLTFTGDATFIYVEGDISMQKDAVITIDTDMTLYVGGDLTVAKDMQIDIQNHRLTVYAGGNIQINKDGFFNPSENPLNLVIYGLDTCTGIRIAKDTIFYGAIYAPKASIDIEKDIAIYGSIIGKTFDIQNNVFIHYDETLKDEDLGLTSGYYVIRQWEETL